MLQREGGGRGCQRGGQRDEREEGAMSTMSLDVDERICDCFCVPAALPTQYCTSLIGKN